MALQKLTLKYLQEHLPEDLLIRLRENADLYFYHDPRLPIMIPFYSSGRHWEVLLKNPLLLRLYLARYFHDDCRHYRDILYILSLTGENLREILITQFYSGYRSPQIYIHNYNFTQVCSLGPIHFEHLNIQNLKWNQLEIQLRNRRAIHEDDIEEFYDYCRKDDDEIYPGMTASQKFHLSRYFQVHLPEDEPEPVLSSGFYKTLSCTITVMIFQLVPQPEFMCLCVGILTFLAVAWCKLSWDMIVALLGILINSILIYMVEPTLKIVLLTVCCLIIWGFELFRQIR